MLRLQLHTLPPPIGIYHDKRLALVEQRISIPVDESSIRDVLSNKALYLTYSSNYFPSERFGSQAICTIKKRETCYVGVNQYKKGKQVIFRNKQGNKQTNMF